MSPLEILFGIISAIATLVTLFLVVHRWGIRRGREQQQLQAAGVRIAVIADVDTKVNEILIALRGSYGAPGLVARVGMIEGQMAEVLHRLDAIERNRSAT